jgi:hypothetical protein
MFKRECKDDRGAVVEVLSHAAAGHWVISGDSRIEAMLYRAARDKGERTGWDWVALFVTAAGAVAGILIPLVLFPGLPGWVMVIPMIGVIAPGMWFVARLWASRNIERLVTVILEEGLCACCGYNLYGLATEHDGCIRCPECGATWKAVRIRRAEPIAATAVYGDPLSLVGNQATKIVYDDQDSSDDKGRPVRILDGGLTGPLKQCRDDQERQRLLGLRKQILRNTRWWRWGMIVLVGAIAVNAIIRGLSPNPLFWVFLIFINFIAIGRRFVSTVKVRRTLLAGGACPSCAEDLRGLAAGAEGFVECPRCRAAWQV